MEFFSEEQPHLELWSSGLNDGPRFPARWQRCPAGSSLSPADLQHSRIASRLLPAESRKTPRGRCPFRNFMAVRQHYLTIKSVPARSPPPRNLTPTEAAHTLRGFSTDQPSASPIHRRSLTRNSTCGVHIETSHVFEENISKERLVRSSERATRTRSGH